MFDSAWYHEQLTWSENDVAITWLDGQVAIDHEEQFVGVLVRVPNELALDLDQLDLVIVQAGYQFWRPVLGEQVELLVDVYDVDCHRSSLPYTKCDLKSPSWQS
jgi:hypothetical protein